MKVTCLGDVPIHDLFETIRQSLQDDYQSNTGQELAVEAIEAGLTYVKHFGDKNQHSVKVEVVEWKVPNVYKVHFQSNRGDEFVTYELKAVNPQETEVSYAYDFVAKDIFGKANQLIMAKLLSKSMKRQFDAQLQALIRYAKEK